MFTLLEIIAFAYNARKKDIEQAVEMLSKTDSWTIWIVQSVKDEDLSTYEINLQIKKLPK